jgi:hypothetical protein
LISTLKGSVLCAPKYTVKKVIVYPVPNYLDVINQTLPDREKFFIIPGQGEFG